MHSRLIVVTGLVLGLSAPALAEDGDAMGFGVGAQAFLTQDRDTIPGAASLTYDMGTLHLDALVGFSSLGNDTLLAGARFYYSVHRKASSDLSLGLGLGVEYEDRDENMGEENITNFHLEGGAKIRAFIVPNVALSAVVGVGVVTGDEDKLALSGQFIGTFGVTYFFN